MSLKKYSAAALFGSAATYIICLTTGDLKPPKFMDSMLGNKTDCTKTYDISPGEIVSSRSIPMGIQDVPRSGPPIVIVGTTTYTDVDALQDDTSVKIIVGSRKRIMGIADLPKSREATGTEVKFVVPNDSPVHIGILSVQATSKLLPEISKNPLGDLFYKNQGEGFSIVPKAKVPASTVVELTSEEIGKLIKSSEKEEPKKLSIQNRPSGL